jgi:hypothetical protein
VGAPTKGERVRKFDAGRLKRMEKVRVGWKLVTGRKGFDGYAA